MYTCRMNGKGRKSHATIFPVNITHGDSKDAVAHINETETKVLAEIRKATRMA